MKKIFFCVSLVLTGLMSSCVDKYEEVDANSKPEWLGSSIYAELENPGSKGLSGTFSTYLRLISDLGEAETLSRTGSKTVFPANDEAFARFFSNNEWGVHSYEELSTGQKKLLLYSSMLDNPLLLQLLPNVSNGTAEPMNGMALKHSTNVSVIDTVRHLTREQMPANNAYWEPYYGTGIDVVEDATRPMMVHLTREFMINNGITNTGANSDFEILTGTPYPQNGKAAYIFNDAVTVADVTCQNGYIHQMQDVVVPPGNMAQVLRRKDNTHFFSRILDYFAVPISVPKVTNSYAEWARNQVPAAPEKTIYALRYLSNRSYDSEASSESALTRMNGSNVSNVLNFDPGWNQYYPKPATSSGGIDYSIMDMGAFFVPNDQAMIDYFTQKSATQKGPGAYLIDIYGAHPGADNTTANLAENLDSLHSKNPQVLTAFINNLMKASFIGSVPSKFEAVLNDASENMGLHIDSISRKTDGKYDITFANNGAIYVMKTLYAPDEYNAVLAPASVYPDMRVMNWAVQDHGSSSDAPYHLDADFKYYLLSMSSNYAFFIPNDAAFDLYLLDLASLGHRENNSVSGRILPDVLHFYYNTEKKTEPKLMCERYYYNMETGAIEGPARSEEIKNVRTQLVDLLNFHTVVLPSDRLNNALVAMGYNGNHYYKTKHGGEIYVDGHQMNGRVMSGPQIDNPTQFPAPQITQIYPEKNGNAYRLSRVIQSPINSVYKVLNSNPDFRDFLNLCLNLATPEVLDWAGISSQRLNASGQPDKNFPCEQDNYTIFTPDYRVGSSCIEGACLDYNVKMFNTYNYTLFAPDNTAMSKAYSMGLPQWSDVTDLYEQYKDADEGDQSAIDAKDEARAMIETIRAFIRYHFVTGSVYADNVIDLTSPRVKTMTSDEMGVAKELRITGSGGQMTVSDDFGGHTVTVNANDQSKVSNQMTREFWYDKIAREATSITTSSFCVVHQISEPLCNSSDGKYSSRRAASRRR
ncbi:MAG: fasciclin domain-containing protein [Prevotella sp.]|nr:fasciclin domain-containing protein [Prevotella sp.]